MEKIQHFVITRFNLRIPGGFTTDKNGKQTLSDEWLDHRFDLFERYCLPSLAAQTNKDFTWLLFFDESTPDAYRQRVEEARQVCPQIQACYINGLDIVPVISSAVDSDTDILITTRIDNDDAFREDALDVIRKQAENVTDDLCVNLRFGFAFDRQEAVVFSQKYNPFSTLVELRKPEGFKTIFGAGHGKIHQLARVKQIKTGPHWLMLVHDKNVTNKMPEDFRQYNLWNPHKLRRYIKKYLLRRLRRLFWSADFRKSYRFEELEPAFHIKKD